MQYKKVSKNNLPLNLRETHKPPQKIFYKGSWIEEGDVCITIIGSRHPSNYGIRTCKKLIQGLKGHGITIISGLAIGIDSIAHKEAMLNSIKTIAIPGSGISNKVIYPRRNTLLAKEILDNGGCIASEFNISDRALPWMFPVRNQTMAGLSKLIIVIEAKKKSGSLITAYSGLREGRDIAAVPGEIDSILSEGTNDLIKRGAYPITSSDDVLDILNIERKNYLHNM